ncbi:hypothetical protein, partial [Pseudomonas aeruginosa]|uniref:hypothetical protein n=1 Tax=Pseudomonas aeruginosa TaxID=287 RepID=UPI001C1283DC
MNLSNLLKIKEYIFLKWLPKKLRWVFWQVAGAQGIANITPAYREHATPKDRGRDVAREAIHQDDDEGLKSGRGNTPPLFLVLRRLWGKSELTVREAGKLAVAKHT